MKLELVWTDEEQVMRVDGRAWTHDGGTVTTPVHDFSHLCLAAHGLPWAPAGPTSTVCLVEWNAVQLQRLFMSTYIHVVEPPESARGSPWWILDHYWEHGQWYAQDHSEQYGIAFPATAEQCFGWFARSVNRELVCRLFPIAAQVFAVEALRPRPGRRFPSIELRFTDESRPYADGKARHGQAVLRQILDEIVLHHGRHL